MSSWEIVLLGAIAGFTIYLGLPVGRLQNVSGAVRAGLNAVAVGILIFLLWDVLSAGIDPVETSLLDARNHGGSWLRFAGFAALLTVCVAIGLMTLVHYDMWLRRRRAAGVDGPGAASTATLRSHAGPIARLSEPKRLALFIALGIGFHNFSEGLAIGQSAASGEISLALLLIIGFGLHNATEGFGIVAPLAAENERPSWAFLGVMGLIGGGPTFLGTIVGQAWVNEWLFTAFLGLAAGSILYVVIELLAVGRKLGYVEIATWCILLGLFLGFATDMVLVAAGT
ncbi:MAG: Zinc permease [Actinomycetia bacterium]|nr:Zinc permease [Actinomycetes bacterium]